MTSIPIPGAVCPFVQVRTGTSVSALYGRMASPGGLGPGQIRAYGEGLQMLEARVGERLMMLAILATARAHDSQYDWTVNEPRALKAGLEPEVINVIRHRRPLTSPSMRRTPR